MAGLAYPLPRQVPMTRGFADTSITRVKSFGDLGAHTGIDLGAPCGLTVLASGRGVVTRVVTGAAALANSGGRKIMVTHSDQLTSEYLHLGATYAREGDLVDAGTVIGAVGASGAATGCHLHFQVNLNGAPVDPGPYLGIGATVPAGSAAQATLAGAPTRPRLVPPNPDGSCPVGYERGVQTTAGLCVDLEAIPDFGDIPGALFNLVLPPLIEVGLNLAILGTAALLIYSGIRQATSVG